MAAECFCWRRREEALHAEELSECREPERPVLGARGLRSSGFGKRREKRKNGVAPKGRAVSKADGRGYLGRGAETARHAFDAGIQTTVSEGVPGEFLFGDFFLRFFFFDGEPGAGKESRSPETNAARASMSSMSILTFGLTETSFNI